MILFFSKYISRSAYWKDVAFQVVGNGFAQIIAILGLPLLTRLYTPDDFALQTLFLQVVMVGSGVVSLSYEQFIHLPKKDSDANILLHFVFILGFMVFIVITPIAWFCREMFAGWLGNFSLAPYIAFIPFTSMLMCYAVALQYSIQRGKNYSRSGVSEFIGKTSYVSGGLIGWCLSNGAGGLIMAPAFSALGKVVCLLDRNTFRKLFSDLLKNRNNFNIFFFRMWKLAHVFVKFSASVIYSLCMLAITGCVPIIFIAHIYGYNTLGQFSLVASTIYLPSGVIGAGIGQVYFQRAAECRAAGNNFSTLWRSTSKTVILMGLPIYAGVALLSPTIFHLVFGNDWSDAGYYARLMAISAFFSFISTPTDRSSVVGARWYPPVWHTTRAITTIGVMVLSWLNNWGFDIFLPVLVIQMVLLYMIDFFSQWYFSLYKT